MAHPFADTDFVKWVNERKRVLEAKSKVHKDIAREMGLSSGTLSMYTTGAAALPFEHAWKLLSALEVEGDEAARAIMMAQEAYAENKIWKSFNTGLADLGMTFEQMVKSPEWRQYDRWIVEQGLA